MKAWPDGNTTLLCRYIDDLIRQGKGQHFLRMIPFTVSSLLQQKKEEKALYYACLYRDHLDKALLHFDEVFQSSFRQNPLVLKTLAASMISLRNESSSPPTEDQFPIQLSEIWRINQLMNTQANPTAVLKTLLHLATEKLGAERGLILIQKLEGMQITLSHNFDEPSAKDPQLSFSTTVAKKVIESGKPLLTLDALSDERLGGSESIAYFQLRSILCVPISFQWEVIGALYLDNASAKGVFSPSHQKALSLLCDQAAMALQNSILLQKVSSQSSDIEKAEKKIEILTEKLEKDLHQQTKHLNKNKSSPQIEISPEQKKFFQSFGFIGGINSKLNPIFDFLEKITHTEAPVLIQGESGTGKELIARAIQAKSPVKEGPFLTINCAAIAANLIESELFGHVRGSFTGAEVDKMGLFEQAHDGTLFLDEVGDMPMNMQVKLLRTLEERKIRRVGESVTRPVKVRIISASHQNLKDLTQKGQFRMDLLYRLNLILIHLPPLRQRKEDILELTLHFLQMFCKPGSLPLLIHPDVAQALQDYSWPGNVRELKNLMEKLSTLCEGPQIQWDDLPEPLRQQHLEQEASENRHVKAKEGFHNAVSHFEKNYITEALLHHKENVSRAARASGMHRSTFRRLMERHGLKKK